MKKRVAVLAILLALCLLFTSCGISKQEARDYAEHFFLALQNRDYEEASLWMHPTYRASAEVLEEYFGGIEEQLGIRFADGMILSGYTSYQADNHHETIGGAYAALEGYMDVGVTAVQFVVTVIRDTSGCGIFDVKFQPA